MPLHLLQDDVSSLDGELNNGSAEFERRFFQQFGPGIAGPVHGAADSHDLLTPFNVSRTQSRARSAVPICRGLPRAGYSSRCER